MQFIDLKRQYQCLEPLIGKHIQQVIDHGRFVLGPEVSELEERLAAYCGVKHCITVANGTDALVLALRVLGIGSGDEVITTSFSFFATAEAILLLGAKPVCVDICAHTYNLNPELIETAITPRTKAILAVDMFGLCAEYDRIADIANRHKLAVVADCAQSFGAAYYGRQSGSLADISCTSFYPAKPLGCYGDGGACFTNDDDYAELLRQLRDHGQTKRYYHQHLGTNSRMDTLQAAIILAKLTIFNQELMARRDIATQYNNALTDICQVPIIDVHNVSSFAQYSIQVANRTVVREKLWNQEIPIAVHYPLPLYQQPAFRQYYTHAALPNVEKVTTQVLSLPCHPYLEQHEVQKIINILSEIIPCR